MTDSVPEEVTPQSIKAARERIAGIIERTALRPSPELDVGSGGRAFLKLENEQVTGSFKIRGASNALLQHLEGGASGVATASTGNHARAVAHVARSRRMPAAVFVSRDVSASRVERLRHEGAVVDTSASDQNEAISRAQAYAAAHGYAFIPPFDDPQVISGQGTIGLELLDELPTLGAVVVPVSGGGLAAGVGLAVKSLRPQVRVIGVCAELAPAMKASLDAGAPVSVPECATVAESLRGDLGADNRHTFRLVRQYLDDVVLVSEEEIVLAQDALLTTHGLAVEGAAAAAAAVVRRGYPSLRGLDVVAIVTGAA